MLRYNGQGFSVEKFYRVGSAGQVLRHARQARSVQDGPTANVPYTTRVRSALQGAQRSKVRVHHTGGTLNPPFENQFIKSRDSLS